MNPFSYGTVVKEPYFFNRKEEIRRIVSTLGGGNNLVLYAPRRYGKTSVVMQAIKSRKGGTAPGLFQAWLPPAPSRKIGIRVTLIRTMSVFYLQFAERLNQWCIVSCRDLAFWGIAKYFTQWYRISRR
jgi:hypothetical protein